MRYVVNDTALEATDFLDLAQRVWPGDYESALADQALRRTLNVTAWRDETLVGCVRVLTDGYFFGTIPEIMVDPKYQRHGIGRALMERAWQACPTGLGFGVQAGNEPFFEKLGYVAQMAWYGRKKPRPTSQNGRTG
ncbi:MAG: GNAT family N-acetyltransferase [Chloroflexi bacterium]|nr:GNAT family N-acetyltransferase [Chloroflexota bacterium]